MKERSDRSVPAPPPPLRAAPGSCRVRAFRRLSRLKRLAVVVLFGVQAMVLGATRFGDITISPQPFASGDTYHGYREFRFLVENQSPRNSHTVTLIYPDRAFSYGNSIDRMSRSVAVAPGSRVMVSLWQPPLPANGNGNFRVQIDDEVAGTIGPSGVVRHAAEGGSRYGPAQSPPAVLVSRSFDFDEVTRVFKGQQTAFTAAMAVGPPDAGGHRGLTPTAWTPDGSSSAPAWLELDYGKPIVADRVRIYWTSMVPSRGEVILKGVSGTNLARVPLSGGGTRPGTFVSAQDLAFPATAEPVETLRLEFSNAGMVGVDAVALEGPAGVGTVWATAARASSEFKGTPHVYPTGGIASPELLRSEVPPSEWSDEWLSYTPFDAVVMRADDLAGMPSAAATALWGYVECGGNLVLLGGGEVPGLWNSLPATPLANGRQAVVGFGQCFILRPPNPADLRDPEIKSIINAALATARYWQSLPDENALYSAFPVVANQRVPVHGTVFLMLAFVILIGPVNLIVLARLKRRTWLLWTIPAISLVTCVMVFAYSLLREGVTPTVRIEGVTLLDQPNHRAVSVGTTGFYCPLTPGQGLFFDSATEATPLVETYYGRYGRPGGTARELDWTQAQHLERGWVLARAPAYFHLRKLETRRERLQLENAGGHLSVINGLGAPVESLWLADRSGKVYTGLKIAAGQPGSLSPSPLPLEAGSASGVRALLEKLGPTPGMTNLSSLATSCLRPGTYLAVLDSSPFLENGLGPKAGSARIEARTLVYGILEPAPKP